MTGFASLTLAEWQSGSKKGAALRRKECILWLNVICEQENEGAEEIKEWKLIYETVNKETLRSAINISDMEFYKEKYPVLIKVGQTYDSREYAEKMSERSKPLLRELFGYQDAKRFMRFANIFQDVIDWNKTWNCWDKFGRVLLNGKEVEGESTREIRLWSWLAFAFHAEFDSVEISEISDLAIKNGWKWSSLEKSDLLWLVYLNEGNDAHSFPRKDGASHGSFWLLENLKKEFPDFLASKITVGYEDLSIFILSCLYTDVSEILNVSIPEYCIAYSLCGTDTRASGIKFWTENLNILDDESVKGVLYILNNYKKHPRSDPLSDQMLSQLDFLKSTIESNKLRLEITKNNKKSQSSL